METVFRQFQGSACSPQPIITWHVLGFEPKVSCLVHCLKICTGVLLVFYLLWIYLVWSHPTAILVILHLFWLTCWPRTPLMAENQPRLPNNMLFYGLKIQCTFTGLVMLCPELVLAQQQLILKRLRISPKTIIYFV